MIRYVIRRVVSERTWLFFFIICLPSGVGLVLTSKDKPGEGMGKRNGYQRPDHTGLEQGIFKHNKAIIRKTATICALCGMPIDKTLKYPDPMSITIDHIIPAVLGGKSTIDNLQAAHWICNRQKGTKIISLNNEIKPKERSKTIPQYIDWSNYEDDLK